MIRLNVSLIAASLLLLGAAAAAPAGPEGDEPPSPYVLDFAMDRLDGSSQDLADYRGKVVMIVNTASLCGLTPQYAGLQNLYETYKDDGFVVLGFPANNFGNQEPGTNDEIAEFCTTRYDVTFPMFAKISVKGEDQHPLYQRLTGQPEPVGGPVMWNFQKYLVDRSGQVVAKFGPRTKPMADEVKALIETLLKGEQASS